MTIRQENYYLKIPVADDLGRCDLFLRDAMDHVAKNKGSKKRKSCLRKDKDWSGNVIKNSTYKELNPRAADLELSKYPSRDAYRYVRKISIIHYAPLIVSVIKEYAKIATLKERQELLDYANQWGLEPTYQQVFCHSVFRAYKIVEADEGTANIINLINNAKAVFETIIADLTKDEIAIRL